jgi:glycogen synthase
MEIHSVDSHGLPYQTPVGIVTKVAGLNEPVLDIDTLHVLSRVAAPPEGKVFLPVFKAPRVGLLY